MRIQDAEDLANFVQELKLETDRGLPLVGTAFIDEKLKDTLEAFFISGKSSNRLLNEANAPLGTLSARLEACFALGLINDYEYAEINLLRKVRNEFAHAKHGISFKTEKIAGLCSTLASNLPEGDGFPISDPKFRYINAVVCIVLKLYHRPSWVVQEKRIAKNYGNENDGKWISMKEQRPPEGTPIITYVETSG